MFHSDIYGFSLILSCSHVKALQNFTFKMKIHVSHGEIFCRGQTINRYMFPIPGNAVLSQAAKNYCCAAASSQHIIII